MPQLIGVACLTSLNNVIFKSSFYNFQTNLECAPANPQEKHYLQFIDLSVGTIHIDNNINEEVYILLEVVSIQPLCNFPSLPVGICILQDKEYAKSIIDRQYFTNHDILDNQVKILWFEQSHINFIISAMSSHHEEEKSICQIITESQFLPKCSKLRKKQLERCCPISVTRFYINYWSLLEKSTQWLNSHISAKNKVGQYLLFVLRFRENRQNCLDVRLMTEIIINITQNTLDNDINLNSSKYDINSFFVLFTKTHISHIQELKRLYKAKQRCITENVIVLTRMVFQPINSIRHAYKEFSLWASEKVRNVIETVFRETPAISDNTDKVISFGDICTTHLQTNFDRNRIFSSIYDNAQFIIDKNQPLKLYGNFDVYLQQNQDKAFAYTVQNIGCISNEKVKPIRCNFLGASFSLEDVFPNYSDYSVSEQKLLENEYFLVPLWSIPGDEDNSGRCFYRLVPSSKKKGIDIMTQLDNIFTRRDIYLEECIQSNLHVSTLPFDLDIHLLIKDQIELVVANLHALCETVIKKIAYNSNISELFSTPLKQYTFISQDGEEQEKLGLHHYVILPTGLVFSVNAVRQIAQILEEVRHQYTDTLGNSEIKGPVFDTAIYPISKKGIESVGKAHCFRFPFQSKKKKIITYNPNGKRKKCVQAIRQLLPHGENKAPEHLWKLCAHAPQLKETLANAEHNDGEEEGNQRVITGCVVHNIKDINYMEDIKYIKREQVKTMTMSANLQNKTNYIDVMHEINKIIFLFPVKFDLKASEAKLLTIINDLWRDQGKKIFKHYMLKEEGTCGKKYSRSDINAVYNANFIIKNNKITLDILNPHLCVRRPHRNYNRCVMNVYISFAHSKCNFRFFQAGCFKSSCETIFAVLTPVLPINEDLIANCIRIEIQKYFEKMYRLKCKIMYGDTFVPIIKDDCDFFILLKNSQHQQKVILFVDNWLISHLKNIYVFYDLEKELITLYSCLLKISLTNGNNVVESFPDWTSDICLCNRCSCNQ